MAFVGHTAWQGASVQCMQAMETERSPGLPSLMVTTRRRLMPHGTSCSFLQAVTQALHSMQRSASQRNFIRAIVEPPLRGLDLAQRGFGFLHSGDRVEAVGRYRVYALPEHDRVVALRILRPLVHALEPAGEVERPPGDALADTLGDHRLHPGHLAALHLRPPDFHPGTVLDAALGGIRRIELHEHLLLQLGEPLVRARLLAAALELHQSAGGEDDGIALGDALLD